LVFVCYWWKFDWHFAHLIAPVVTTTTTPIILRFNKIQNGAIPVQANSGPPGKMAIKMKRESRVGAGEIINYNTNNISYSSN